MLRPLCFRNKATEDLEGGNLWRNLESLRCLPAQNEPLLHGVRSQASQSVGRRICARWNYSVNNCLTNRPNGMYYLLRVVISANHDNLFNHCDLIVVHHITKWIPINISVILSASIRVVYNEICLRGTSAWSWCVQQGSFCPVETSPLRRRVQISASTEPSWRESPSYLTLPGVLYKFVVTRPASIGAHSSFYHPSLSLRQPRWKWGEMMQGRPPQTEKTRASSSEEGSSCIQRIRTAAVAKQAQERAAMQGSEDETCNHNNYRRWEQFAQVTVSKK
jgi:hypothetical protein